MTKSEIQAEAIDRARNGQSVANYVAIYSGFAAKGIAQADILPRENIFTFHAWKALGRSVKRGEHGVKVVTFIEASARDTSEAGEETVRTYRKPHTTTVFHISQTEPTSERKAGTYQPRPAGYYGHNRPIKSDRNYGTMPDPGELAADRWNETH
jgi:hypothetical protein